MTIQGLDIFFRTQLILDKPQFFNSITNLALAPLQHLVGQNQFKSLKGKVDYVPQKTTTIQPSYLATLFKVVVFVCNFLMALVLTPIGTAARYMSFRSPQVTRAYFLALLSFPAHQASTLAFLSQCTFAERTNILKRLPPPIQAAFLNLDENEEYSKKYLSEITKPAYNRLWRLLSGKLLMSYLAQKAEKNRVDTKQTQPLPPSHVNTSAVDDLDTLLDATLEEFGKTSCSSSSVQSVVVDSVCIDENFDIEPILVDVEIMGLDKVLSLKKIHADVMVQKGQLVNEAIEMLNLFFKSLLQNSDNLGLWLEQESKTSFYRNCHPFAASYSLETSLNQATRLHKYLNRVLIEEWEDNNRLCVALLKSNGLDQYNATKFPFSENGQLMLEESKQLNEILTKHPYLIETFKMGFKKMDSFIGEQQGESFAENPFKVIAKTAQDPQIEEMKTQAGTEIDPVEFEALLTKQIQQLILFFQKLDQVLQNHSQDATAVEDWLKAEVSQPNYSTPFYVGQEMLQWMLVHDNSVELFPTFKQLFNDCCRRLITLGLQRYIDETPPPEIIADLKSQALQEQEDLQKIVFNFLTILRPLSQELKRLPVDAEALNSNRETINRWFLDRKFEGNYSSIFTASSDLYRHRALFEEVLDSGLLQEFSSLHSFCRDQLMLLGLNNYLEEMPSSSKSV
jgi:hypothetical protein